MVTNVTSENQMSYSTHRMAQTMRISSNVGSTLNNMNESRNSMPRLPRSMARLSPPVWRSR